MATLDDINSTQQQGVKNLGLILQALRAAFIQFGGSATSATAGSASALPGPPASYIVVTLPDGTIGKIPVYNT